MVPEPSVDETYQILLGLRERYEAHHKLRYTDDSLDAAAKYSSQYISDRFLPDKAIDLIDEAGSRVRLRHAQLPEEAREFDKELKALLKEKDAAVRYLLLLSATHAASMTTVAQPGSAAAPNRLCCLMLTSVQLPSALSAQLNLPDAGFCSIYSSNNMFSKL